MNDDVIRRSDVKKAIFSKPAYHGSDGSWYHSDDIRDAVDSTPSADTFEITKEALIKAIDNAETVGDVVENIIDRPQEWIPCSERLPEVRRSVILSTKEWTGEGCYWETTEYHVIWKGYRWNATYWDDEVLAWMPLPEAVGRSRR